LDTVYLICDRCEHKWSQEVEFISDIIWRCPKCQVIDVSTLSIEYEDEEAHKESLERIHKSMGRGGCGRTG